MNAASIRKLNWNSSLSLPAASSLIWPLCAIAIVVCLHLSNALGRAINWDEFFHYSLVHELAQGTISEPLQTLQARLFLWLTWLPGDGIDHIIAARLGMFGCVIAVGGATYWLARGFTSKSVALLCTLAWLSAGFVLQHGTSFRADAMAAALLMVSLAIMTNSRLSVRDSVLAAIPAALAILLTLKAALYAPCFIGIAYLRWQEADRTKEATMRLLLLASMVVAFYILFFLGHASGLQGGLDNALELGTITSLGASDSAVKMFQPFAMPFLDHDIKAALTAPLLTVLIIMTPPLLWHQKLSSPERIALLCLAAPILSIFFFANALAYYFVFILPPIAVACCISLNFLLKRSSLLILTGVFALCALGVWALDERGAQDRQRKTIAAANLMFPKPVAYIDFSAMLGHFPNAHSILPHWNPESDHNAVAPILVNTLKEQVVPLLIENDQILTDALRSDHPTASIHPKDIYALRDSYIHFWGPYWIAGEEFTPDESRIETIRVPGPYRVTGAPLAIDNQFYLEGEIVNLERKEYKLDSFGEATRLIWGEDVQAPAIAPPSGSLWTQF